MSIEVSAYLVDWEQLVRNWNHKQKSVVWFFDSVDNNEPWVEQYRPDDWINSWKAAVDCWLLYEEFRPKLKPVLRKSFDKFLGTFLASGEDSQLRVRELAGKKTQDGVFEVTISPPTVKEYLKLGMSLPIDDLKPLFDEYTDIPDPDYTRITGFGDFRDYIQQWIALLQEAAMNNKGIVISAPY